MNQNQCFPNEKLPTTPNKIKNRKIKRDAVLIGNKFVCPLCFTSKYQVIKTQLAKGEEKPMKYTAICRECGIRLIYFKDTPIIMK